MVQKFPCYHKYTLWAELTFGEGAEAAQECRWELRRGFPGELRERFRVPCGTGVCQTTVWSKDSSHYGAPRAGPTGGGWVGSPRCMRVTDAVSVTGPFLRGGAQQ